MMILKVFACPHHTQPLKIASTSIHMQPQHKATYMQHILEGTFGHSKYTQKCAEYPIQNQTPASCGPIIVDSQYAFQQIVSRVSRFLQSLKDCL
jgi:hypothetical protein